MYECSFELNNKPMSAFKIGAVSFPAFSGLRDHVNQRVSACLAHLGPIPPGTYYIFDRQSGLLGSLPFYNIFNERSNWFALYAIDGNIDDDKTYCNKVKRGLFRLHPKGAQGISEGCITIESPGDYQDLRGILKRATPATVSGSTLQAYGKVVVR